MLFDQFNGVLLGWEGGGGAKIPWKLAHRNKSQRKGKANKTQGKLKRKKERK
jgi:hypothetical protein